MSDDRRDCFVSKNDSINNMSTEELENLISKISLDKNADYKLVNELLEIYNKREGVPDIDVNAAWERFKRDYSGQGEIYLTEDADNPTQTDSHEKNRSTPRYKRRRLRHGLVTAAVLIVIIIAALFFNTTVIGVSLWQAFLQWGQETFGFSGKTSYVQIDDGLTTLREALKDHGITASLAPTWIPDSYEMDDFSVMEFATHISFTTRFMDGNNELLVQIVSYNDSDKCLYEKSGEDVLSYKRNGVDHYITKNEDKSTIVWVSDNYECYISGEVTVEEAGNIIDSIYER